MNDYPAYLLTILDDPRPDTGKRSRILATRQVFKTRAEALNHARGIAFRKPRVLPCFLPLDIVRK